VARCHDVTGDGISEVVAGCFDGRAYLFDGVSGTQLWNYYAGHKVMMVRGVRDLSGNGVPDVVAGTQMLHGGGGRIYALEGNDATPVRTPAVAGRALRAGIEVSWEADLTAPGTVFNIYRRDATPVDRAASAAASASRVSAKVAIATSSLPSHEKLQLAQALSSPTAFERLNSMPIIPDGPLGRFVDTTVERGRTYEYQVGYLEPGAAERMLPAVTMRASATAGGKLLAIATVGRTGQPHGFQITLPATATGDYRVALYGIDGRLLQVVEQGPVPAAATVLDIAWDGRAAPLTNGVYLVEARVAGKRATSKFVWIQ